jgi:hypothetical protein
VPKYVCLKYVPLPWIYSDTTYTSSALLLELLESWICLLAVKNAGKSNIPVQNCTGRLDLPVGLGLESLTAQVGGHLHYATSRPIEGATVVKYKIDKNCVLV